MNIPGFTREALDAVALLLYAEPGQPAAEPCPPKPPPQPKQPPAPPQPPQPQAIAATQTDPQTQQQQQPKKPKCVPQQTNQTVNHSETFDFTRCVRPDGSAYGTGGKCRLGTESDKIKEPGKAPKKHDAGYLTKKKIASLTDDQLKALIENPKLLNYQRERLQQELDRRGGAKPAPSEKPKSVKKPPAKPKEAGNATAKGPTKVTDEKLKAAFNKALAAVEAAERERKELQREGVDWKDPRSKVVSEKMGKAQEAVTTIRQAYHAVDRDRFLKEVAAARRLELKSRAIRREVDEAQRKEGLNPFTLPSDHPLKRRLAEASRIDEQRVSEIEPRKQAAFYGEPSTVTKAKSDGGGEVHSSIPSRVPRGGASQDLKDFLNGSQVVMAFPPSGFAKFVKEGEAKNGFQKGTGGIKKGKAGYLEGRRSGEEKVMGIEKGAAAEGRPVYAALEHPDRARSLQGGQYNQMANYGGIQVVMNPSVKDRATFTIGDSLDYNAPRGIMASPVRDPADPTRPGEFGPKSVHFNPGGGTSSDKMTINTPRVDIGPMRPSYVEAQIHGGLKTSDIQEVRYYRGHEIPPGARKLLEKQGVKIIELPPQMGDLHLYSDNPSYKDITAISPEK